MKVRPVVAVLITMVAGLSLFVVAQPAMAIDGCSSGRACLWEDAGYNTNGNTLGSYSFQFFDSTFHNNTYAGTSITVADMASSVWNQGNSQTVYFYLHVGCDGPPLFTIPPLGNGDGNLNNGTGYAPAGFNDALSSGAFSGYQGC